MQAILYVGHGSRVKEGNDQFRAFLKKPKAIFPAIISKRKRLLNLVNRRLPKGLIGVYKTGQRQLPSFPYCY